MSDCKSVKVWKMASAVVTPDCDERGESSQISAVTQLQINQIHPLPVNFTTQKMIRSDHCHLHAHSSHIFDPIGDVTEAS